MRTIAINDRHISIKGISNEDGYFNSLVDGIETDFANLVRTALDENSVALDIGANIGLTAIILGQHLTEGHVHAFEPGPTVYNSLVTNVLANNVQDRVTPHNIAVSDRSGPVSFFEHSAWGCISPTGTVHCQSITVDDFVRSQNLSRLDFIKIDVEGFEPAVLSGATETIKKFNPLIYMEFNSWALTAHSKTNTVDFANSLVNSFDLVYVVSHPPYLGRRVTKETCKLFAHDNMVRHGCVENLLIVPDEDRILRLK